jgi:hypothetical protein
LNWILSFPVESGFYSLLEFIRFDVLRAQSMILFRERFMSRIPYLTDTVVENLWDRLLLPVQPQTRKRVVPQLIDCSSTGIIQMLTEKYGANPVNSYQILLTISAHSAVPQEVFEPSDNSGLTFYEAHNAWIKCEFVERELKVTVTRWMIKVVSQALQVVDGNVEVILEAGMGSRLIGIDHGVLKIQGNVPATYEGNVSVPMAGKFFQIRFSCPCAWTGYMLTITRIEFFGLFGYQSE